MPTICTVFDLGNISAGRAVCLVGWDDLNSRPRVARATLTVLNSSKTVLGVSLEDKDNGDSISIAVSGDVVPDSLSALGLGLSRVVVADSQNPTEASQSVLRRVDEAANFGGEKFVVGTCDTNGNVVIQPRHFSDDTGFPKVFNVREFGAWGDGVTNDAPAIQAALNAAAPVAGTVYLGPSEKGYRMMGGITIPRGVRLLGDYAGGRKGLQSGEVYFPEPDARRGSLLLVDGSYRGHLIVMSAVSTVQGIEIYYPDQPNDGMQAAPDVYDWAIISPAGSHSSSILDVCLTNAYQGIFVSAGGHRIDNVWGWCIFQGISLGRCADVTMVTNCELNPNAWVPNNYENTWRDWHNLNGRPYRVDGAEGFMLVNCFAFGGLVGCTFEDLDQDDVMSGGHWVGGGFDYVNVGFLFHSGIGMTGVKIQAVDVVPFDCALKFDDQYANYGDEAHKPRVMVHGLTVHNANANHYPRVAWFLPWSKSKLIWSGGFAIDYTNELIWNESPTAVVRLFGVEGAAAGILRINDSGGGDIVDVAPIL